MHKPPQNYDVIFEYDVHISKWASFKIRNCGVMLCMGGYLRKLLHKFS